MIGLGVSDVGMAQLCYFGAKDDLLLLFKTNFNTIKNRRT